VDFLVYWVNPVVEGIMAKPILPDDLRRRIIGSFGEGLPILEVFDSVHDEAAQYVEDDAQLSRCLASLKGKSTIAAEADITVADAKGSRKNSFTFLAPMHPTWLR